MPILNRGYVSLFEFLVRGGFPFAKTVDQYFYPYEQDQDSSSDQQKKLSNEVLPTYSRRWNPKPHSWDQIMGACQPLGDMYKDVVDTFKPYKSPYHLGRDFTSLFRGVGNLAKSVANLIGAPLVFLVEISKLATQSIGGTYQGDFSLFLSDVTQSGIRAFSWFLEGIFSGIRGVTQIITTPLTWLRIPLRVGITWSQGAPKIEDSQSIQNLAQEGLKLVQPQENDQLINVADQVRAYQSIRQALHQKFLKKTARGQFTNIYANEKEQGNFNEQTLFAKSATMVTVLQTGNHSFEFDCATCGINVPEAITDAQTYFRLFLPMTPSPTDETNKSAEEILLSHNDDIKPCH